MRAAVLAGTNFDEPKRVYSIASAVGAIRNRVTHVSESAPSWKRLFEVLEVTSPQSASNLVLKVTRDILLTAAVIRTPRMASVDWEQHLNFLLLGQPHEAE
jgi:hypothetical protein